MISVLKRTLKITILIAFNISPILGIANGYINNSRENISKFASYFEDTDEDKLDGICSPFGSGFCSAFKNTHGITKKVLHYDSRISIDKNYWKHLPKNNLSFKGHLYYYFSNLLDLSSKYPLHLKFIFLNSPYDTFTISVILLDNNGNHIDFGYQSLEAKFKNKELFFSLVINQGGNVFVKDNQYDFDMSKIKCIKTIFHYGEITEPEMIFDLEDINIVSEEELISTN